MQRAAGTRVGPPGDDSDSSSDSDESDASLDQDVMAHEARRLVDDVDATLRRAKDKNRRKRTVISDDKKKEIVPCAQPLAACAPRQLESGGSCVGECFHKTDGGGLCC